MARIEITLQEYNSLKEKNKALEDELTKTKKKLNEINELYEEQKDRLDFIVDCTFLDRVLRWKKIING